MVYFLLLRVYTRSHVYSVMPNQLRVGSHSLDTLDRGLPRVHTVESLAVLLLNCTKLLKYLLIGRAFT